LKGVANHIELHAAKPEETLPFYKDLLGYFEWPVVAEWPGGLGMGSRQFSLWFFATSDEHKGAPFNRDATGIGHLGIHVDSAADVDRFVEEYLKPRGIATQFDTPRKREDFNPTYYQVMFLDPEGLAIEVYNT
jgi:catechol 2,3-dioxygenase-like lactoylglutathione lyase family enzyme